MTATDETMRAAIRTAWQNVSIPATWYGLRTGWNPLDTWTLAEVVQKLLPARVYMAGGLGEGGLPLYVADLLDGNHRGAVVAAEKLSREKRGVMPSHRRIQWLTEPFDEGYSRHPGGPQDAVLAVGSEAMAVASSVTVGSYVVVPWADHEAVEIPEGFVVDQARDPLGMSSHLWLMRIPR